MFPIRFNSTQEARQLGYTDAANGKPFNQAISDSKFQVKKTVKDDYKTVYAAAYEVGRLCYFESAIKTKKGRDGRNKKKDMIQ